MTLLKYTIFYPLLILVLAAGNLACGDNPVDDDGHDDHAEVDGLQLVLDGIEVYRVLELEVGCEQEPCGIEVIEGRQTGPIAVEFLDHDGDRIHEDDLDEDFSLDFEIADPAVASFEQNEEDGIWNFRITGEQAGETSMRLHLEHLGEHPDFSTPPLDSLNALTIRVAPD